MENGLQQKLYRTPDIRLIGAKWEPSLISKSLRDSGLPSLYGYIQKYETAVYT